MYQSCSDYLPCLWPSIEVILQQALPTVGRSSSWEKTDQFENRKADPGFRQNDSLKIANVSTPTGLRSSKNLQGGQNEGKLGSHWNNDTSQAILMFGQCEAAVLPTATTTSPISGLLSFLIMQNMATVAGPLSGWLHWNSIPKAKWCYLNFESSTCRNRETIWSLLVRQAQVWC